MWLADAAAPKVHASVRVEVVECWDPALTKEAFALAVVTGSSLAPAASCSSCGSSLSPS
jgi:hypothetical protein